MADNPNIVVNARFELSEETLDAMREPLLEMQSASRAENGCQDYTFSLEIGDPLVLRITERWDDLACLEAHFAQPHMATFQAAMAEHPPQSGDVHFYEVDEIPRPGS